jgi:hypothetical protein
LVKSTPPRYFKGRSPEIFTNIAGLRPSEASFVAVVTNIAPLTRL